MTSEINIEQIREQDIHLWKKYLKIVNNKIKVFEDSEGHVFKREIHKFLDLLINACKSPRISEDEYEWIVDTILSWETFLKIHFLDFEEKEIPFKSEFLALQEAQKEKSVIADRKLQQRETEKKNIIKHKTAMLYPICAEG